LGALLSSNPTEDNRSAASEIPVDLIDAGPMQPRTLFDESSLVKLADSIKSHGIVQPVLVRPRGERYEVVAGERRLRAARMAGLASIPVVVRDIRDEDLLEIALIENIQREELNPIEEAEAYKKLIEAVGLTQEALADRVGRDRSYITNYLRLLRLPDDLQDLVRRKRLSTGHARTLLGLPDIDQQRRAARHVLEADLSVRATEKLVRKQLENPRPNGKPRPIPADANTRAAEDKLRRSLSAKVKILVAGDGRGKIEISFADSRELDRIYSLLLRAQL
jgi:ParB family chromosome partitioning protein